MSGIVGVRVNVIACSLAIAILMLAGSIPEKAGARADIDQYLTSAPNSWEPMGYNVNGTAAKTVVDQLGWNQIKICGNVGIGNGSMQALNDSTTPAGNYTNNYFMGADISTAPLDYSRLGRAVISDSPDEATNSSSTPAGTSTFRINNMGQYNNGSISFNSPLGDIYHPIHAGNPVNDMQYQNPCSLIICDSAMLRGLRMPGGTAANICIRCLGYGY